MERCSLKQDRPLRLRPPETGSFIYFPLSTETRGVVMREISLDSLLSATLAYTFGPEVTVKPWLKGFSLDFLDEIVTTPKLETLLSCSAAEKDLDCLLVEPKAEDLSRQDESFFTSLGYETLFLLFLFCFYSYFLVCSMARFTSSIFLLRMLKKGWSGLSFGTV